MSKSELKLNLLIDEKITMNEARILGDMKPIQDKIYDCFMCRKGKGSQVIKNCLGEEKKVCVYCHDNIIKGLSQDSVASRING